ncbi:PilZ domain-containing protein [Methylomonas rivi]|uniref:PilZ domain-containing protein n=1 Tax=Methylomonas rivi TaxID=2952226 RepID=A0ABT1U563_9GAMM|nr:PilZ domain-containing protein [Methylomonas sp. WSC-6]MCQ8128994.1 PilZ domain-containing protein [Methylomonas sp. WSC-6]
MANNDFMGNTDFLEDIFFDELDQEVELDALVNKRISVRYRRNDIKAIVKTHSLLFPRLIKVVLLDISSKGAAIQCNKKLKPKSRVSFFLKFQDGRRFTIQAIVANNQAAPRYGLKFDTYQTELADHLLSTQTDLLFS